MTFRPLHTFLALLLLTISAPALAQDEAPRMTNPVSPTPDAARAEAFAQKQALVDHSLVGNVAFRNVGPTVMSGRVVDVDVSPADPSHLYVAYASGGLWYSSNNGTSFTPLFDDQASMTIGDIAVDWTNDVIWVGTGENNASRSSYAGTGIYKSTDGGATWQHVGLDATQRTGRIVLHPADPNTVWVAASGPLYHPSPDRGIYKTTDGGTTWEKTLFVDDDTGAIDLVIDPTNPDVLYAAMWHRERRAWNFVESGTGSGIWKSTDGGETWARLTTEGSGFPTGEGVGRIGLAVFAGDPQIVYAVLDNQNHRPEEAEEEEQPALTRDMLRDMPKETFMELAEEDLEDYLRRNGFPAMYTAKSVLAMVRDDEIAPIALVEYLEDANQQLFDTPVIGAEVYRSDDGGATWQKTHEDYLDGVFYSYGYYFGQIRVAPDDVDRIYIMGVPILKSEDGGKTFSSIGEQNVHGDHHALWVSATRPGHIINGNDGGLNISFDDGETWFKANTPPVGQFYSVEFDMAEPYRVYGGLQDNGVWRGPSSYSAGYRWYAEGDYPYDRLLGGDGMQVAVDTRTNELVYAGFQFGNYFRIDAETGRSQRIQPHHKLGERPLRFNWMTPILLSPHNQDILYMGAQRLFRSLDKGEDWEAISPDLTQGGQPGDVPYGTLSTIDESPLKFGVLYAGSDDGLIHVSRDAGATWQRVSDDLPQDLWVSRVEASHHDPARVYATLNGYRWDNFEPYVYASDDYGASWRRIGQDLPTEAVNVITEDPENEDLLYVGTDHGLYVSLDRGQSFMAMYDALPYVPVHDVKVQPRDKDLVVGTHGRSIYVAHVAEVEQLTQPLMAEALHLFDLDAVNYSARWGSQSFAWSDAPQPDVQIAFYSGAAGETTLRVKADDGTVLQQLTDASEHGLNYVTYHLTADPDRAAAYEAQQDRKEDEPTLEPADDGNVYLVPGKYTVELERDGHSVSGTLEVQQRRGGGRGFGAPAAEPSEAGEMK